MSYLKDIASLVVARLTAAGVAAGSVERGRIAPMIEGLVPRALVYVRRDNANAAGDARVTQTELFHTTTVAVALYDHDDTDAGLEDKLDAHLGAITSALLEDAAFMSNFEGCSGLRSEIEASADPSDRLVAELVVEFDLLHGTIWLPTFDDPLEGADITSVQPDGTPEPGSKADPDQS